MESNSETSATRKRSWDRLPLSVPVFVRNGQEDGIRQLELGTALNISGGGVLIATRRYIPVNTHLMLEFPTAPWIPKHALARSIRMVEGVVTRVTSEEECYLAGIMFDNPLMPSKAETGASSQREELYR